MPKPQFNLNVALSIFKSKNKNIRFISGKWFVKDAEITEKEAKRIFWNSCGLTNPEQLKNVMDLFLLFENGTDGLWPEMPIVKEAMDTYDKFKGMLPPLPYPLTHKQLKVINYLVFRHDEEKLVIATGVGGSGKSTFANIICQIFGGDVAHLNLEDLCDDYKLATGIDKRLIYSDELNSEDLNNGVLKTLISNQKITINGKFQTPFTATWQSVMFFSCNKPPRLSLDDSGMMRRILYLYMNEKIKNPDPKMQKMEFSHVDLITILCYALKENMSDWTKDFEEDTHNLLMKDNSVYLNRHVKLYSDYVDECKDMGLKPYSEPKWESIKETMSEWGCKFGSGDSIQDEIDELNNRIKELEKKKAEVCF